MWPNEQQQKITATKRKKITTTTIFEPFEIRHLYDQSTTLGQLVGIFDFSWWFCALLRFLFDTHKQFPLHLPSHDIEYVSKLLTTTAI